MDISGRCQGQVKINIMPLEDLSKFRPSGAFRMLVDEGDADASRRFLNPRSVYQTTALYEGTGFPAHVSRFVEQRIRMEPDLQVGGGGGGGRGGGGGGGGGGGLGNERDHRDRTDGRPTSPYSDAPLISHAPTAALPPAAPHSRVEFVSFEAPVRGPTVGHVVAKTMLQKSIGELDEITRRLKIRLERQTDDIMTRKEGGGGNESEDAAATAVKQGVGVPGMSSNLPPPYPSAASSTTPNQFDPTGPPLFMRAPTPLTSIPSSQRPGPLGIWQRELSDENYNSEVRGKGASTTSLGLSSTEDEGVHHGGQRRYEKIIRGGEPRSYLNGSGSSSSSSSRTSSRSASAERPINSIVDYSVSSGKDDFDGFPLNTNTNNENYETEANKRRLTIEAALNTNANNENDGSKARDECEDGHLDLSEITTRSIIAMNDDEIVGDARRDGADENTVEISGDDDENIIEDPVDDPDSNDIPPNVSEIWEEAGRDETEVEDDVSPIFDDDFECDEDDTTRLVLNDSEELETSHAYEGERGGGDCGRLDRDGGGDGNLSSSVVEGENHFHSETDLVESCYSRPYEDPARIASISSGSSLVEDPFLSSVQLSQGLPFEGSRREFGSEDNHSRFSAVGEKDTNNDDEDYKDCKKNDGYKNDDELPSCLLDEEVNDGEDSNEETEEDRQHVDALLDRVSSLLSGLSDTVSNVGDISLGEIRDDDDKILGLDLEDETDSIRVRSDTPAKFGGQKNDKPVDLEIRPPSLSPSRVASINLSTDGGDEKETVDGMFLIKTTEKDGDNDNNDDECSDDDALEVRTSRSEPPLRRQSHGLDFSDREVVFSPGTRNLPDLQSGERHVIEDGFFGLSDETSTVHNNDDTLTLPKTFLQSYSEPDSYAVSRHRRSEPFLSPSTTYPLAAPSLSPAIPEDAEVREFLSMDKDNITSSAATHKSSQNFAAAKAIAASSSSTSDSKINGSSASHGSVRPRSAPAESIGARLFKSFKNVQPPSKEEAKRIAAIFSSNKS